MRGTVTGHDRSWWSAVGLCLSLAGALGLVACGGGKSTNVTGATESVQSAQDEHGGAPVAAAHGDSAKAAAASSEGITCTAGDVTVTLTGGAGGAGGVSDASGDGGAGGAGGAGGIGCVSGLAVANCQGGAGAAGGSNFGLAGSAAGGPGAPAVDGGLSVIVGPTCGNSTAVVS